MSGQAQALTILMGTTGPLAGSKFDIGPAGLIIGLDKQKRIAVTTDARQLSVGLVRITAVPDGTFALDAIGGGGAVTVDGSPVRRTVSLTRLHVIDVGQGVEFVFRRSTGTPQATPAQPAQSETPPARSPGTPVAGGTMVDAGAFDALPAIGRKTPRGAESTPPANVSDPSNPRPPIGTIVNADPLANITDPRRRRDKKTPPAPAATPEPPSPQLPVGTMGDAGAMPDISDPRRHARVTPSAAPKQAAPPAAPPARKAPPAPSAPPPPSMGGATQIMETTGRKGDPSPYEIMCALPDVGMQSYRLNYGDNVVGRSEECDVLIPGNVKVLSRRHAIIKVSGDTIEIHDLKGQNGTFVNGKRVDMAVLTVGSSFLLGNIKFALVKA